jgi:hypothetical protein
MIATYGVDDLDKSRLHNLMSIGADRVQINLTTLKGQMKRSVFSKSIYIDI